MNITFDWVYAFSGSSFGFLYVLSSSYGDELTRKNFLKSLFIALKSALASVPLSGLAYHLLMGTHLLNSDLAENPVIQGGITFLVCVRHERVLDIIFGKYFKNKKS